MGEHTFEQNTGGSGLNFKAGAQDAARQITEIQEKRMNGQINDAQWRNEYSKKVQELGKIVQASYS